MSLFKISQDHHPLVNLAQSSIELLVGGCHSIFLLLFIVFSQCLLVDSHRVKRALSGLLYVCLNYKNSPLAGPFLLSLRKGEKRRLQMRLLFAGQAVSKQ